MPAGPASPSHDGQTTKIHALTDVLVRPGVLLLTPGNASDLTSAPAVLVEAPGRIRCLAADKGYDADWLRTDLQAQGIYRSVFLINGVSFDNEKRQHALLSMKNDYEEIAISLFDNIFCEIYSYEICKIESYNNRKIRLPHSTKPIWVLTLALVLISPLINSMIWINMMDLDYLSTNQNSTLISIFAGILMTIIAAPLVIIITHFCIKNYNNQTKIFTWRSERPIRSTVATILFGSAASTLSVVLASNVWDIFRSYSWAKLTFIAFLPPTIAWALAMRAALIDQIDRSAASRGL